MGGWQGREEMSSALNTEHKQLFIHIQYPLLPEMSGIYILLKIHMAMGLAWATEMWAEIASVISSKRHIIA